METQSAEVKPVVKLIGEDGNAFLILGKCIRVAKRATWSREKIDQFMKEAKSGDYDNLLCVVQNWFDVE